MSITTKGLSSKTKPQLSPTAGYGLFASEHIAKGEVILDLSSEEELSITKDEADRRYSAGFDYMVQVDDDRFVITVNRPDQIERGYINHSCNPNCGIKNSLQIVAMRDIKAGEEITFDYAVSESSDYTMRCSCGFSDCRKIITGQDWKREDLQERYNGHFSPYLNERIGKVRK